MNYDKVYQIWEKEFEQTELIKLDKDFYKKVEQIIKDFNNEIKKLDSNSLPSKLLEKEIDNIKKMIKSIYLNRFEKIFNSIKKGNEIDIQVLTENEINFYNKIQGSIQKYVKNIDLLLEGQSVQLLEQKIISKYIIVRFLKELPEIVGNDMKTYGPFQVEDIATLPKKVAESLLERGAASIVPVVQNNKSE